MINISSDVSVSTESPIEGGADATIEAVLLETIDEDRDDGAVKMSDTNNHIHKSRGDRGDNRTSSRRSSLANSGAAFLKATKFWRQQTHRGTLDSSVKGRNDGDDLPHSTSGKPPLNGRGTNRRNLNYANSFESVDDKSYVTNDIVTVVTNPITDSSSNGGYAKKYDILAPSYRPVASPKQEDCFQDKCATGKNFFGRYDRNRNPLLDDDDDDDDDDSSATSSSPSWARDDDDTYDGLMADEYPLFNSSNGVIRE